MNAICQIILHRSALILSLFPALFASAALHAAPPAGEAQQLPHPANVPGELPLPGPAMVAPSVSPAQTLEVFHPFHGRIVSGCQPVVQEDLVFLKAQGIKTIVSVDGATPGVAAAKKLGMRCSHLPIGYDGVPQEARDFPAASRHFDSLSADCRACHQQHRN